MEKRETGQDIIGVLSSKIQTAIRRDVYKVKVEEVPIQRT
ncbi:hypothetical protein CCACVL1_24998 [Corchorus capsularis]|uniref:Uncharacterized protein n=1 Tax=Corchorus capsularis TaxID=210143 RepID=A0A1R3GM85_COCAP|nr:hypothetical protein CCACVL1_24998 [Corchorus capsularis]